MPMTETGIGLIPIHEVEATLRHLWQAEGVAGAARASTLNLLVVLSDLEALDSAQNTVEVVAAHHPSRAIFLVPDTATPDPGLAAEVRVLCPMPETTAFCCEYIILHVREDAWPHVHSTVLTFLLPELPVGLWWERSVGQEEHLFRRLQFLADLLIVDAAVTESPEDLVRTLPTLSDKFPWGCIDLVWTRLLPWRELLAQTFDPLDRRPYLDNIDRVSIRVTPDAAGTAAALYLSSWLASRLGWIPSSRWRQGAATRELTFRRGERKVRVSITRGQEKSDSPVLRVRVHAGGVSPAAFTVAQHEDPGQAEVTVDIGHTHVRQVVPARWPDRAAALSEALHMAGRDRVFEDALRTAERLMAGS